MKPVLEHSWNLEVDEAVILQKQLAFNVVVDDDLTTVDLVAGVDVAYDKESDDLVAGVVILKVDSLEVVDSAWSRQKVQFPYIPGLFSFRELPPVVSAFDKLRLTPDLCVCDGQGIAHPLRFGLASHLGVLFDIPTIGCAKTRLLGENETVQPERGSYSYLHDAGNVVGTVVRTQTGVNPVYVSPGHRISIDLATQWVLRLSPNFRLPETTRKADQLVRDMLKESS